MSSNQNTIHISKRNILIYLLGGIVMSSVSALLVLNARLGIIEYTSIYLNPKLQMTIGVIGLTFFMTVVAALFIQLFNTQDGIIFNGRYFETKLSFAHAHIDWDEVTGFETIGVHNQRFLAVHLKDAERLIEASSGLSKLLYKQNLKNYDTPLLISTNLLDADFDVVRQTFLEYHQSRVQY